jgi:1,4-alpha-glucan branching enzyme
VPVRFAYEAARAKEVSVVGDFTRWKPLPMKRSGQTWFLEIALPPGRYLYAFLVDKRIWQPDPWATSFDEGSLGKKNSVLIVE